MYEGFKVRIFKDGLFYTGVELDWNASQTSCSGLSNQIGRVYCFLFNVHYPYPDMIPDT